jgi:hypothetical protein
LGYQVVSPATEVEIVVSRPSPPLPTVAPTVTNSAPALAELGSIPWLWIGLLVAAACALLLLLLLWRRRRPLPAAREPFLE